MSLTGIVTVVFMTLMYVINVVMYLLMIKKKEQKTLLNNVKFLAVFLTIYVAICIAFWVVITLLFYQSASLALIGVYLLATAYCIWCIHSMVDMVILPYDKKKELGKLKNKLHNVYFAVSIADAVIFLGVMLLLISNNILVFESQIVAEILYICVVVFALVALVWAFVQNLKQRKKAKIVENSNIKK